MVRRETGEKRPTVESVHPDTLRVRTRILDRLGHQVTPVTTVHAALAAAAHGSFDLIISDMSLPDGDGPDVLAALREAG